MISIFQKNKYLGILLIIATAIRIIAFLLFDPIITTDTPLYADSAEFLRSGDFSSFDGIRTFGYPFLLYITNLNYSVTVLIQMLLGISVTVFIYFIVQILTGHRLFALIGGLAYTLYLPFLRLELVIATEILALFYITLCILLIVITLRRRNKAKGLNLRLVLITTLAALAAFTRPVYLFLPYWIILFFMISFLIWKTSVRQIIMRLVYLIIPVLFIFIGWKLINWKLTGYYTYSTASGIFLSNKVAGHMEIASDEFSDIRDIYVKYRDKQLEERGDVRCCVIWRAFDEMQEKTGLSTAELCNRVKQMSIDVIKKDPVKYLRTIPPALKRFYKPMSLGDNANPNLKSVSKVQRMLFILMEFLFFGMAFLYFLIRKYREKLNLSFTELVLLIFLYGTVIGNSVIASVFEQVVARYSMPTDPIILFVTLFLIYRTAIAFRWIPSNKTTDISQV